MEKFLFYGNTNGSTGNMVCIPVSRLTELVGDSSDENRLPARHDLYPLEVVGSDKEYAISLTIDQYSVGETIKAVSRAISTSKNPFIVVGDDLNKTYITSEITGVSGIDGIA